MMIGNKGGASPRRPAMAPQYGVMLLPVGASIDQLIASTVAAEDHGLHSVWTNDHLEVPHDPSVNQVGVLEAWTTVTWLAARTDRIRFGHQMLCDGFRHPALLSKMAATLDVFSSGRLELGLGWGSMPQELERFGYGAPSAAARSERLNETLEIVRLMFTGTPFDYDGIYFQLHDAQGNPTPMNGHIPIHIGGAGPTLTLPLVARHADWWNCPSNRVDDLDELSRHIGDARIAIQRVVGLAETKAHIDSVASAVERRFGFWGGAIVGTPDEVAAALAHDSRKGVELTIVQFHDFARPETVALFAHEVMPAVQDALS